MDEHPAVIHEDRRGREERRGRQHRDIAATPTPPQWQQHEHDSGDGRQHPQRGLGHRLPTGFATQQAQRNGQVPQQRTMVVHRIETAAVGLHALRREPRAGRLIGMKRPLPEFIETQENRRDDHTHPADNNGSSLHPTAGYDERIPTLAMVNWRIARDRSPEPNPARHSGVE